MNVERPSPAALCEEIKKHRPIKYILRTLLERSDVCNVARAFLLLALAEVEKEEADYS